MARVIQIDEDTLIGYDYKEKLYYITNKDTTTTRPTKEEAKQILDIVAPNNTISLEDLEDLYTTLETLYSLSYTYADNSSYIKTIQLNTYAENPLTIDLALKKLYIMNTNLIFDLTLNEAKEYRIPYLIDYYKQTLGLLITTAQMTTLYNLLLSYYSPTFYATITKSQDTDTLFYTNTFNLSNYNNTSKVTYSCTYNPNNVYTGNTIADIVYINQDTRTIQLTSDIPSSLQVEDKILIENAITVLDQTEYTADGMYTITGLDEDAKIIQVAEQFPVSYAQEYLTCYLATSETPIAEINRDTFTVTLTNVPDTIQIGDKIFIKGTQQTVDQETVSADGEYTIANISGNALIVQEQLPISFTPSAENEAIVYKELPLAYVSSIAENTVTLFDTPTLTIGEGDIISIANSLYEVTSYSDKVITLETTPQPYTLEFAHLQEPVQEPLVKVDITASTLTNVPTGSFILDTFEQCQQYVNLITPNTQLPSSIEEELSNRVPMSMALLGLEATCEGFYSDIYSGEL